LSFGGNAEFITVNYYFSLSDFPMNYKLDHLFIFVSTKGGKILSLLYGEFRFHYGIRFGKGDA